MATIYVSIPTILGNKTFDGESNAIYLGLIDFLRARLRSMSRKRAGSLCLVIQRRTVLFTLSLKSLFSPIKMRPMQILLAHICNNFAWYLLLVQLPVYIKYKIGFPYDINQVTILLLG